MLQIRRTSLLGIQIGIKLGHIDVSALQNRLSPIKFILKARSENVPKRMGAIAFAGHLFALRKQGVFSQPRLVRRKQL